jgi:hypothetical protein
MILLFPDVVPLILISRLCHSQFVGFDMMLLVRGRTSHRLLGLYVVNFTEIVITENPLLVPASALQLRHCDWELASQDSLSSSVLYLIYHFQLLLRSQ